MDVLIPILFILVIILLIVTVVGHLIWLTLAWFFRTIFGSSPETPPPGIVTPPPSPPSPQHTCANCQCVLSIQLKYCGVCGALRPTPAREVQLRELEITLRQLERLHQSGSMAEADFRVLKNKIVGEREQLLFPNGRPGAFQQ